SKSYPENFKVALGNTPSADAMTITLADYPNYLNADGENKVITFSVENDGVYHLGFHCYSAAQMWQLQITNVGISVMEKEVPAPVDNLTVTAGAMGAMNAIVSFTAPTVTAGGNPLSSITAINVYRNDGDAPVHVFSNPVVGAQLTWEDNGMTEAAVYTYRVVAVNDEGESLAASASAFVGVDAPGAPVNLRLVEQDGKAVLTWQAPTQGRNGGYFDASNLTYQIWRYDNYTKLVDSQTATTYTDESTASITDQTRIDYVVFPYSGTTRGAYGLSNAVIFGRAYNAPLIETFRSSTQYGMNYYPWVGESDKPMNQGWTLESAGTYPVTTDQNGDNGMAAFHSRGESAGIHARFSSPKISVKGLKNPELSFYMYHSHDDAVNTQECIEIEYSLNGVDFIKVEGVKFMRDNGSNGWARHSVMLPQAQGSENLRIAFLGTTDGTPTEGMDIYIDNITIADGAATDLEATTLTAPSRIATGVEARIALTVTNTGTSDINAYTVTMTDAQGNQLASVTQGAIAVSEQHTVSLNHTFTATGNTTIKVTVNCDGDEKASNDVLERTINVVEPVIPSAYNLDGVLTGKQVNLQWTGAMNRGAVTDSIEAYTDFAIDSIGDWTTIDQDFQMTYYINKDLEEYPNMSSPKAWQVCNAAKLGINIWPEGTPHSGDKMLMAMSTQTGPNNDWLISPELNGSAQVISFFAKSFTDQGGNIERMRVLYSTTDTDPLHFTPLHESEYIDLSATWSEYVYTVPQGTKYFAIQCISPGGETSFALFVDDLSFNDLTVPAWDFKGYEIYRNGVKIGESATNLFTDTTLGRIAKATYTVKTIFEQGTSAMSNEWTLTNPADLNGDGKIDVEDVNAIINIILHLANREDYPGADLNGDSKVDVEDVNAMINFILGV
ncbi:MAG: choice-of-anchor J domain-containing protein, partial [Muribaculaceae bacterium]|nr:choice-of-anchor J domain-containing protein [Muribaculaceae bacterium]